MSWINDVVNATQEAEPPECYIYWSALVALSATVQKRVWWNKFFYNLYPNIYVFLIGDSGLRKGFPVGLAVSLVKSVGSIRVLTGRNSIQGILKELSKAKTLENGHMQSTAQAFLASGEFSSFIIDDPVAVKILTELHNTHEHEKEYSTTLKTEAVETLKEPCIQLLGASNMVNLDGFLSKTAISGGFVARTFMVTATENRVINSLMTAPKNVPNIRVLSDYLKEVYKLEGEFKVPDIVRNNFDLWYKDLMSRKFEDPTGSLRRVHDQILKVTMLLSLSDNLSLEIKMIHLDEALEVCKVTIAGMKNVIMGAGKSTLGPQTRQVIKLLINREGYEMSRQKILSRCWGDFDYIDLDRIVQNLTDAGIIRSIRRNKDMIYILEEAAVQKYIEAKEEIQ